MTGLQQGHFYLLCMPDADGRTSQNLRTVELDITLQNGDLGGYVSFATFLLTASLVAKHGLPLPLVVGLESPPWALV